MSSSYRSNRLGLSHWDAYTVRRGGCLELYYCNMMEWFWWDGVVLMGFKSDLWRPTGLLQCFDTVDLVIWLVKIVPKMTYYVSEWDVKPYTLTHPVLSFVAWKIRIPKTVQILLRYVINCHDSADIFISSVGWAIHISWSKCSLFVWMLTRVAQIVAAAHRDL